MAVLDILRYPDTRLHTVAKPVKQVDERVRTLVADMAQTMYAAPGIGLAATQVDVHEQVIVIDLSDARDHLQVFINPDIIAHSDERADGEEGCLSVPGKVFVQYLSRLKQSRIRGKMAKLDRQAA
jgi:peptide deformylase